MTAMLNIKDLRAYYGQVQALHGLEFGLNEGSLTTLLGANGAGKTTTLARDLQHGALHRRDRVRRRPAVRPLDRKHRPPRHRPCAAGPRHLHHHDGGGKPSARRHHPQATRPAIVSDIERMYDHFPVLKERHTQQAGTLSGGEQQMLAVARALMLRPRLMLLDEPSFGLAPLIVRDLFKILGKINREDKVTILVVEQNAQLALELADKAYVIETGRIVMSGSAAEIANNEDVRKSYLGY